MKRNLFLSAILPFSLAVALCACGSTPGESTPSEKTQSSVSQAQTDSAATGNEISIGNNFSIEAGTVLSDGSIYFVGREGADGFCAYVSTDDGQTITDAHTATDGRCLTVMVLVAVIAIKSKIVVCQSEVCSCEESVILFRQPIAELRLNSKCAELDG